MECWGRCIGERGKGHSNCLIHNKILGLWFSDCLPTVSGQQDHGESSAAQYVESLILGANIHTHTCHLQKNLGLDSALQPKQNNGNYYSS